MSAKNIQKKNTKSVLTTYTMFSLSFVFSMLRYLYDFIFPRATVPAVSALDATPPDSVPFCAICLEDVVDSASATETVCEHTFHYECLRKWKLDAVHAGSDT